MALGSANVYSSSPQTHPALTSCRPLFFRRNARKRFGQPAAFITHAKGAQLHHWVISVSEFSAIRQRVTSRKVTNAAACMVIFFSFFSYTASLFVWSTGMFQLIFLSETSFTDATFLTKWNIPRPMAISWNLLRSWNQPGHDFPTSNFAIEWLMCEAVSSVEKEREKAKMYGASCLFELLKRSFIRINYSRAEKRSRAHVRSGR